MRSDLIGRALTAVALVYALAVGGTYNGLTDPRFRLLSLAGLAILLVMWLAARWRGRWAWTHTPLDGAAALWALAFGLSLLANQDVWRRSAVGLWYMGLYAGLWYMLLDALASRHLTRAGLLDALLLAGATTLVFGYLQVVTALGAGAGLPRPVSTLGNPNSLAAVLVALLPLALARAANAPLTLARVVYALYALAAGLLLVLTRSRGAWIGAGAGLVVLGVILLAHYRLLSLHELRSRWAALSSPARTALALGAAAGLLIAAGVGVYLLRSLSEPGRDLGLRTYLWEAALTMGSEQPLTGQGLFAFGHNLSRFDSIPPRQPHAHAHSAPLQVFAELGLAGVLAAAVSVGLIVGAARRGWEQSSGQARLTLAGAGGAVAAFAVHHLTDFPGLVPAVALVGLVSLAGLTAPAQPSLIGWRLRRLGLAAGLVLLWAALLVAGTWASLVYGAYLEAMREAVCTGDYRGAADRLAQVTAAEPNLSLYHGQRGYILGLAARTGDREALAQAVDAYQQAAALEPYHAPYHANLAVLLWSTGQLDVALTAMQQAAALAPDSWQLQYTLGLYAEALGLPDVAAAAYDQALLANPDADLYPAWGATDLQAARGSRFEHRAPLTQAALLLNRGHINEALGMWERQFRELLGVNAPGALILRALLELTTGDRDAAVSWLEQAAALARQDDPWVLLGTAQLARFDGDVSRAEALLTQAQEALRPGPLAPDDPFAGSVAYAQFHRQALERYFLPQLYYPTADPALVYLLNHYRSRLRSAFS